MRLFKRRAGLLANKKGNVLVMAAAAMPLVVGSAGLAVDTIQLSLMKRHLQRAADSAALAGAYAKVQSKPVDPAVTKALGFNDAFPLVGTPDISQPATGTHANRSVRVEISARRSLPFLSFFSAEPTITVDATAALVYTGKFCMVSLDESNGTGITFSGNSTVDLGCGVISNTTGSSAVVADGSAEVTASPVAAVGGVPSSTAYVQPTLLLPYSLKQRDPFGDLSDPAPPTPCAGKITDSTDTITPGGCYAGIDVNSAKTLPAGTYYLTGDLTLNSNAHLIGEGVTLVFTKDPGNASAAWPAITINGNAELDLTAPTSGTYEGVLMHYDSRAPNAGHTINGNSFSKFEGAFYFPSQNLTFNGNSEMDTNCIQLVALRLTFSGNTFINNECPTDGGAQAFDASWVRLVA